MYVKRFLAMVWYRKIKDSREQLENHISNIQEMISKYNVDATDFKG